MKWIAIIAVLLAGCATYDPADDISRTDYEARQLWAKNWDVTCDGDSCTSIYQYEWGAEGPDKVNEQTGKYYKYNSDRTPYRVEVVLNQDGGILIVMPGHDYGFLLIDQNAPVQISRFARNPDLLSRLLAGRAAEFTWEDQEGTIHTYRIDLTGLRESFNKMVGKVGINPLENNQQPEKRAGI